MCNIIKGGWGLVKEAIFCIILGLYFSTGALLKIFFDDLQFQKVPIFLKWAFIQYLF